LLAFIFETTIQVVVFYGLHVGLLLLFISNHYILLSTTIRGPVKLCCVVSVRLKSRSAADYHLLYLHLYTPQQAYLMSSTIHSTVFEQALTDELVTPVALSMDKATRLFDFFKACSLFRWTDANNDCEDRANAICILLDAWKISNYKGWVFSGYFYRKENGSLRNKWNYHVAASVPVMNNGEVEHYIIDPATTTMLVAVKDWAGIITEQPLCYHFIKHSKYYIFSSEKVEKDNWHKRDKRNYRWTMQGLSGINAVSSIGKAQLIYRKEKVKRTELAFNKLRCEPPSFLK
jgi:hypothetical protein